MDEIIDEDQLELFGRIEKVVNDDVIDSKLKKEAVSRLGWLITIEKIQIEIQQNEREKKNDNNYILQQNAIKRKRTDIDQRINQLKKMAARLEGIEGMIEAKRIAERKQAPSPVEK